MAEEAKWYVVHTYSGYENKVASNLEKTVENRQLQELIQEIRVPTEKVTEITEAGKRKEVESWTGPWRASSARWRRWTWRKTACASPFPCLGVKPPWSWSWTKPSLWTDAPGLGVPQRGRPRPAKNSGKVARQQAGNPPALM